MRRSQIILTGLTAIALVIGTIIITGNKKDKSIPSTTQSTTSQNSTGNNAGTNQPSNPPAVEKTITYTNNGFSPSSLTVKAGDTLTLQNNSSSAVQVQSDPHPVHNDDPELNIGVIEAGKSTTFTVTIKGVHGYHNHLDPSQAGTLVVQ